MTFKPAASWGNRTGVMHSAGRHARNKKNNPFLYPEYDREPAWQEQANCKGKAFELFEYQEKDSPLTEGMKYKQRIAFNRTNFQLAEEICIECPVMLICGSSATAEEKMWTVRGGEIPTRFEEEAKRYDNVGRPVGSRNKNYAGRDAGGQFRKEPGDRVCQRGHTVPGGGRCQTCKREGNTVRQRAYREAARKKADGVT